jgi:hypothetical protein
MDLAEVIALFQFPLIQTETKEGWEQYANKSYGWLEEGLVVRQKEIEERIAKGDSSLADEQANLDWFSSYLGGSSQSGIPSIPSQIYQPIGEGIAPDDGPGPCKSCFIWCPNRKPIRSTQ